MMTTVSHRLARISLKNHVRFKSNGLWKALIVFVGEHIFVPCKIFPWFLEMQFFLSYIPFLIT